MSENLSSFSLVSILFFGLYFFVRNIILAKKNEILEKKLNSAVFPGSQGGPLMHVIAAKAVCFKEALEPEFKIYIDQVMKNAN